MSYYITGKKIKEGIVGNDSMKGLLNEYMELGWEYVATHLHIKHLFNIGALHNDDIIVTLKDRMFLYTGFWHNVIPYEEWNRDLNPDASVVDLCNIAESLLPNHINGRYEYFESDLEVIKNIDYKDISYLPVNEKYCCMHLRYRGWAKHRNLDEGFWHSMIEKIRKKNQKIFIFGKDTGEFCDGDNIISVNLDEYASLLNNKNCEFLIGTVSGGSLVAQLFSHKNCTNNIIVTDSKTENELSTTRGKFKAFYHAPEFNFSGAPINFITMPQILNFIGTL